ncbi:hypothetical protein GCM10020254_78350 [Streptomyces goshikiensis]
MYFGGYYTTAAPLSKQLKQAGVNITFMGGDGVFDAQFITTNDKAEGDLATGIGAPCRGPARRPDLPLAVPGGGVPGAGRFLRRVRVRRHLGRHRGGEGPDRGQRGAPCP